MTGGGRPESGPPLTALADWRLPVRGEAAVDLAFRYRVPGIQFDLGGPGRGPLLDAPGRLARLARTARAAGVVPLAVTGNVLNDIGLTAPEGTLAAARVQDVLRRLLDAAAGLGAPLVFVPSFRRSAIDTETALRRTALVLRAAAERAAARGLVLASENTLTPRASLRLIDEVGSPAFRLLLDTYNARAAGLDPVALVTTAGAHLADQVHAKDGPAGADATPLLGEGDGEVGSTLAAMAAHGPPVRALVLENDHRAGDATRLCADLDRLRALAARLRRGPGTTVADHSAEAKETAGTWASR
ncbi:sugar phosphate isomerase/epimerase family protein [Streptomyces tendae]|uniref:sugar phosphate isomerase/epimerase family protein n=1 Tax=Streptomyces tendae TaxID=1932 RepID=UPI003720ECE2